MHLPLGPCSACSACSASSSSEPCSWAGGHGPLFEASFKVERLQVWEALTSIQ